MKQYADRDIMELDKAGGYYCRHVSAMTGEGLHSKSDIAAELAHRDMTIDRLRQGDTCARVCECTAYRTELKHLRAAVRKVMPANWEEDPDWVLLAEGHNLVPNDQGKPPAANEPNKGNEC